MRVNWNATTLDSFSTSNGVKQGGVISPVPFNVYLKELIMIQIYDIYFKFKSYTKAKFDNC